MPEKVQYSKKLQQPQQTALLSTQCLASKTKTKTNWQSCKEARKYDS